MFYRDHNTQLKIADLLAKHMAAADILGRRHVQQLVKHKSGRIVPLATTTHKKYRTFDDSDDADILSGGFSTDLPATGAADYLRSLTPVTKLTFDGLTAVNKRNAFTIAGTADVRLIGKIRDELADIAEKGGTEEEFDAAVNQLTSSEGVEQLNAFTLDTAFNTAIHRAYSLGRYEQLTDAATVEVLPYWQYFTVGDDRVRPEHAELDGFVARATDAVWHKIYPPSGFNCRCIVVALLPEEAADYPDANEPGLLRLPPLAALKVPTPGFGNVFA